MKKTENVLISHLNTFVLVKTHLSTKNEITKKKKKNTIYKGRRVDVPYDTIFFSCQCIIRVSNLKSGGDTMTLLAYSTKLYTCPV